MTDTKHWAFLLLIKLGFPFTYLFLEGKIRLHLRFYGLIGSQDQSINK